MWFGTEHFMSVNSFHCGTKPSSQQRKWTRPGSVLDLSLLSRSWRTGQYFGIDALHTLGVKWRTGEHHPIYSKDFQIPFHFFLFWMNLFPNSGTESQDFSFSLLALPRPVVGPPPGSGHWVSWHPPHDIEKPSCGSIQSSFVFSQQWVNLENGPFSFRCRNYFLLTFIYTAAATEFLFVCLQTKAVEMASPDLKTNKKDLGATDRLAQAHGREGNTFSGHCQ